VKIINSIQVRLLPTRCPWHWPECGLGPQWLSQSLWGLCQTETFLYCVFRSIRLCCCHELIEYRLEINSTIWYHVSYIANKQSNTNNNKTSVFCVYICLLCFMGRVAWYKCDFSLFDLKRRRSPARCTFLYCANQMPERGAPEGPGVPLPPVKTGLNRYRPQLNYEFTEDLAVRSF